MSISTVHYYLLLSHCLSLRYLFVPSYTFGTLLHSTVPLHISMVLYLLLAHCLSPMVLYYLLLVIVYLCGTHFLLLAPCLSIWYSTIFFWLTAYTYDSLLPLSLLHDYTYDTILPYIGSLPIPLILYCLLLTHCLSYWYSTTFHWPTSYTYVTLLRSTGSLPIPLVLFYLLLTYCLYLRYSTIVY